MSRFATNLSGYTAEVTSLQTATPRIGREAAELDPDARLVMQTQAGDARAFAELVSRHEDVVLRLAARIVGEDESYDVAQDAFLRAFHRIGGFRGDAPFRAWLLRIAHNGALDALDRRRRLPLAVDPHLAGEHRVGASPVRTPVDRLDERERRDRLRDKLRLLTPAHRSVLVLRDVEGLSYDEIAAVTDMPLGTVKGRIHRARRELGDLLRNNQYDWGLPRER